MKLAKIEYLVQTGPFSTSSEWKNTLDDLQRAITSVVWPAGNTAFILNPSTGRGRGEGNGVKPIKEACMLTLQQLGWNVDERNNPLRLDATKKLRDGRLFGVEWETGNISSSHRSINRMFLGHRQKLLVGGALIVPTRKLYCYLTDRVGNWICGENTCSVPDGVFPLATGEHVIQLEFDWPEIQPKTVRDRIYLALKKKNEPLHFRTIATLINQFNTKARPASAPTVHNELIKDGRFVLVGRACTDFPNMATNRALPARSFIAF